MNFSNDNVNAFVEYSSFMRCIYNYNNCADTLCLDDEFSDKPKNGDFVWTFDLNNKPPNYLKSRT